MQRILFLFLNQWLVSPDTLLCFGVLFPVRPRTARGCVRDHYKSEEGTPGNCRWVRIVKEDHHRAEKVQSIKYKMCLCAGRSLLLEHAMNESESDDQVRRSPKGEVCLIVMCYNFFGLCLVFKDLSENRFDTGIISIYCMIQANHLIVPKLEIKVKHIVMDELRESCSNNKS